MAIANLDILPPEILHSVTRYVCDTHRPSLLSLALTNKTCHEATTPYIFREISITIKSRHMLLHDYVQWVDILSRNQAFRHVRAIYLVGRMPSLEDDRNWTHGSNREAYDEPNHLIHTATEKDEAWTPLVQLIGRMGYLTSLIWDCYNQFPPSLLETLHSNHLQCRIDLHAFEFRSLGQEMDPDELALITSPCLHSLQVTTYLTDTNRRQNYNKEAAMRIVAGLAPNLKEVRMIKSATAKWSALAEVPRLRSVNRALVPWNGFPGITSIPKPGHLTSLSLSGRRKHGTLEDWSHHTDFSSLRHLSLDAGITGDELAWALENCVFPGLATLSIYLDREDRRTSKSGFVDAVVRFMAVLPPLDEIHLSGHLELEMLSATLAHHGEALRKLSLQPSKSVQNHRRRYRPMVLNVESILQMVSRCSKLEDLGIPVRRTKSQGEEVKMYKAIAKIPRLEILKLTLDCSNPSVFMVGGAIPNDPSFNDLERQFFGSAPSPFCRPRIGHLRDSMMNSAVDETLARSIWDLICDRKVGKQLQSLTILTRGGGTFGERSQQVGMNSFISGLSRDFLITRGIREGDNTVVVEELGCVEGSVPSESTSSDFERPESPTHPPESIMGIFRRIWPRKEGSSDWKGDWTSLPLIS